MTDQRCSFCYGSGRYASLMTNWDAVPCWRCNGTGEANLLVQAGEAASRNLIAQLDTLADTFADAETDSLVEVYAR